MSDRLELGMRESESAFRDRVAFRHNEVVGFVKGLEERVAKLEAVANLDGLALECVAKMCDDCPKDTVGEGLIRSLRELLDKLESGEIKLDK